MNNLSRRVRSDRTIKALIGSKTDPQSRHYLNLPARMNNLGATTRMILDPSRWASGTAVYELGAIKINHQLEEMDDPRTCLATGLSSHPLIASDGNGYKASMPDGSSIPEECITCVVSALLNLSSGTKEVPVVSDLL